MTLQPIPGHLVYFRRLRTALQDWARQGFPQTWPLLGFSDDPTRLVPARLLEADELTRDTGAGLLVNAFPSWADGTQYFQLRLCFSVSNDPEIGFIASDSKFIGPDHPPYGLITELLIPGRDAPNLYPITEWVFGRLVCACNHTNRKVVPIRPSLRPSAPAPLSPPSLEPLTAGTGIHRVPDRLGFFVRTHIAMRQWAQAGFPQAWPLVEFSDEPTRFIPIRLIEPVPGHSDQGPAVLINGFPAGAHGSAYFQLSATLLPTWGNDPTRGDCWLEWEAVDENDARTPILTEFIAATPDQLAPDDLAAWFLEYLTITADSTNRQFLPTQRSLRPLSSTR